MGRRPRIGSLIVAVLFLLALMVSVSLKVKADEETQPLTAKEVAELKLTLLQERMDKLQAQFLLAQRDVERVRGEYQALVLAEKKAKEEAEKKEDPKKKKKK